MLRPISDFFPAALAAADLIYRHNTVAAKTHSPTQHAEIAARLAAALRVKEMAS